MENEFAAAEVMLNAGRFDEAAPVLEALAREGNPKAQLALSLLCVEGRGIAKSTEQALAWAWCAQATFEYYNYKSLESHAKNLAFHIGTNLLTEDAAENVIASTVEIWPWCQEPFQTDRAVIEKVEATRSCKNCDFRGLRIQGANWGGVDLSRSDLSFIDAPFAMNLESAKLSHAELVSADLDGADLSGANLTGARLWLVKLEKADLTGADLSDADLSNALLVDANLTDARLTGATLTDAIFCNTTMPDGSVNDSDCRESVIDVPAKADAEVAPYLNWRPHCLAALRISL